MSIIIQNISPDAPLFGKNRYRIRINDRVICEFDHDRQISGLAQCLRDAADAVEERCLLRHMELIGALVSHGDAN